MTNGSWDRVVLIETEKITAYKELKKLLKITLTDERKTIDGLEVHTPCDELAEAIGRILGVKVC